MIPTITTPDVTSATARPSALRTRWAAIGAAVAVTLGAGGLTIVSASGSPASSFVAITPERILDTRPGVAIGLDGPLTSPAPRTLQVTGSVPTPGGNSTVVPPGATGVVLNVTAVAPTAPGFISVRPDGTPGAPTTSNLNFEAGAIIPNAVTVALSPAGAIEVTYDAFSAVGPTTNVLIDVTGYYVKGGDSGGTGSVGPQGPAGPAGPQGDPGTSGAPGTPGASGPEGPAGAANRISNEQIALGRWDQDPGRPATINVGNSPNRIATDGSHVWATQSGVNRVVRIDPLSNTVVATIQLPGGSAPSGITFDGTHMWVANFGTDSISRIDRSTNQVTDTRNVGDGPLRIAFDGTNLWVTNALANSVSKLVPALGTYVQVNLATQVGNRPTGIIFDGSHIWVANSVSNTISKIDPVSANVLREESAGQSPQEFAFDGDRLWLTTASDQSLRIVDRSNGFSSTVLTLVGAAPDGISYDGQHLWVAASDNTVVRIDPRSRKETGKFAVGTKPSGVVFDGRNIWVANSTSTTVSKLIPF